MPMDGEGAGAGPDADKDEIVGRPVHAVLPRLPIFSGDAKDTTFDLWSFEIKCLQTEGRAEADIRLAIRRSLKGQASRTLMSLGTEASVENILSKLSPSPLYFQNSTLYDRKMGRTLAPSPAAWRIASIRPSNSAEYLLRTPPIC